jgi:ATP-binding cassette subfamily B protein
LLGLNVHTCVGLDLKGLVDAAESIGFSTLVLSSDYKTLAEQIPLPCIAHWRQRHYVVVYEVTATKVVVADPGHGLITYSRQDFLK